MEKGVIELGDTFYDYLYFDYEEKGFIVNIHTGINGSLKNVIIFFDDNRGGRHTYPSLKHLSLYSRIVLTEKYYKKFKQWNLNL